MCDFVGSEAAPGRAYIGRGGDLIEVDSTGHRSVVLRDELVLDCLSVRRLRKGGLELGSVGFKIWLSGGQGYGNDYTRAPMMNLL
jgi:hypothetical protein